jgi:hypothetical protein
MALFQNQQHKNRTFLIIAGLIILIILAIRFVFGVTNILKIFLFLIEALLLLSILFGAGYLFYYLFIKKQKYDPVYVHKQKLIDAGKKCNLENLKALYLSGDKGHTRVHLGKIIGYCRIQVLKRTYIYEEATDPATKRKYQKIVTIPNERGEQIPQYDIDKEEQDVFIVRAKGFLSIFTDPMVIRVAPSQHDELVGDVTLYGYSLIPISEYWYPNSDYLDQRKIDFAILRESERSTMFEGLRDMKEIVDKAVGLDSRHKKEIESKALYDVPEVQQIGRK